MYIYNDAYKAYANLPTATISINRNKLKSYDGSYFLKDKQEFEIELFNPTQTTKLAVIEVNGKRISKAGLVLKPGKRVYLERFFDIAKKFIFETYSIDGTDAEAVAAIAKNGDVKVLFYDEKEPEQYSYTLSLNNLNSWQDGVKYRYSSIDTGNAFYSNSAGYGGASGSSMALTSQATPANTFSRKSLIGLQSPEKETGRIEQGSQSNQRFTNYNGEFKSYTSSVVYIKLLPFSEKPLEIKDLTVYCIKCGTKNKKGNYVFCPKCGKEF